MPAAVASITPGPLPGAAPSVRSDFARRASGLAVALLALALAACAQQKSPGYYSVDHENTLSDARMQAQGRRTAQAPSQIKLGFGDSGRAEKPAAGEAGPAAEAEGTQANPPSGPVVRPLQEAKTFLGTVPCLAGDVSCEAARVTVTLAPNGEWRSRTQVLDAKASRKTPLLDRGCWLPTGMQPWRIVLKSENPAHTTSLTFVNDNVLRINAINGVKPLLDYHLTRQADVDGIDEMGQRTPLNCRN